MRAPNQRAVLRAVSTLVMAGLLAVLGTGCQSDATSSSDPTSSTRRSPTATSPSTPDSVKSTRVDSRTVDLMVSSPAVGRAVPVLVILPTAYASHPTTTWPVLYLLPGCCDRYDSWNLKTDIKALTKSVPVIVVMPSGGDVGFYSDWVKGPKWETFHTIELPKLLKERFHANGKAAIAGLSMGGLGAMVYTARHPDLYAAAASFSGVTNTLDYPSNVTGLLVQEGEDPNALWGDPDTDVKVWQEHNPLNLAERLKGRPLYVSCGSGEPGPFDAKDAPWDATEQALLGENTAFVKRLHEVGATVTVRLYGAGVHNWPYWEREFHRAWPMLAKSIGVTTT